MRVGICTYNPDTIARDAALAEQLGFDYAASGEHLFFHGPTPNAFVALAAAAGATRRIRLLSSIVLVPLYPPALCAKLASTLDRVSHGRFEFGIGVGGEYPAEFDAVGVDPATRFRRLDESLAVMTLLFAGDPATFAGEFCTLSGVRLDPPPVQRPRPPIWLAGRKPGGIRRAGRYADVWMPYMITPERFQAGLAEVRGAATDAGRSADAITGSVFLWSCIGDDRSRARAEGIAAVSASYSQDFTPIADRYLLLGTPDDALARLREYEQAGAERVIISVAADPAHHERIIRTFAADVLPALNRSGS